MLCRLQPCLIQICSDGSLRFITIQRSPSADIPSFTGQERDRPLRLVWTVETVDPASARRLSAPMAGRCAARPPRGSSKVAEPHLLVSRIEMPSLSNMNIYASNEASTGRESCGGSDDASLPSGSGLAVVRASGGRSAPSTKTAQCHCSLGHHMPTAAIVIPKAVPSVTIVSSAATTACAVPEVLRCTRRTASSITSGTMT